MINSMLSSMGHNSNNDMLNSPIVTMKKKNYMKGLHSERKRYWLIIINDPCF